MTDSTKDPVRGFTMISRQEWRRQYLENTYSLLSRDQLIRIFGLYQADDIDISLFWQLPDLGRSGNHFILGINLAPSCSPLQTSSISSQAMNRGAALFEQTNREKVALLNSIVKNRHIPDEPHLKYFLTIPNIQKDSITHDFASQPFLILPIQMHLLNTSWSSKVQYELQLLSSEENNSGAEFLWTGRFYFSGELEPAEHTVVDLSVRILKPGVYDLNSGWQLLIRDVGGYLGSLNEKRSHSRQFILTPKNVKFSAPRLVVVSSPN